MAIEDNNESSKSRWNLELLRAFRVPKENASFLISDELQEINANHLLSETQVIKIKKILRSTFKPCLAHAGQLEMTESQECCWPSNHENKAYYFFPSIKDAFNKLKTEKSDYIDLALAIFETNYNDKHLNYDRLGHRVDLVQYLSEGRTPFFTQEELRYETEYLIDYLADNFEEIKTEGISRQPYLGDQWFRRYLSEHYPSSQSTAKMPTKNQSEKVHNIDIEHRWYLVGQESLLLLKLEALQTLLGCLKSGNGEGVVETVIQKFYSELGKEILKFSAIHDYERYGISPFCKRVSDATLSMNGSLENFILFAGLCKQEININLFKETKKILFEFLTDDLPVSKMKFGNYFLMVQQYGQGKIECLLDKCLDLENKGTSFWTAFSKNFSPYIKNAQSIDALSRSAGKSVSLFLVTSNDLVYYNGQLINHYELSRNKKLSPDAVKFLIMLLDQPNKDIRLKDILPKFSKTHEYLNGVNSRTAREPNPENKFLKALPNELRTVFKAINRSLGLNEDLIPNIKASQKAQTIRLNINLDNICSEIGEVDR